jgi:hypothetical protein
MRFPRPTSNAIMLRQLWTRLRGFLPTGWRLRRSAPEGRETSGFAGAAADQIRTRHQPENRQDARPRCAADLTRPRRRGDRVTYRKDETRWPSQMHFKPSSMRAGTQGLRGPRVPSQFRRSDQRGCVPDLLDAAHLKAGDRVLDVACGAGLRRCRSA